MNKKNPSDLVETIFAGILFVGFGTLIASGTVRAQGSAACETKTSPDAACTVPTKKDDSKICFGSQHPRCFEVRGGHLSQTLNGLGVQDLKLTSTQEADANKQVSDLNKWLLAKKAPTNDSNCLNSVSIELKSSNKTFCLATLDRKETDAKANEVIAFLEGAATKTATHSSKKTPH